MLRRGKNKSKNEQAVTYAASAPKKDSFQPGTLSGFRPLSVENPDDALGAALAIVNAAAAAPPISALETVLPSVEAVAVNKGFATSLVLSTNQIQKPKTRVRIELEEPALELLEKRARAREETLELGASPSSKERNDRLSELSVVLRETTAALIEMHMELVHELAAGRSKDADGLKNLIERGRVGVLTAVVMYRSGCFEERVISEVLKELEKKPVS